MKTVGWNDWETLERAERPPWDDLVSVVVPARTDQRSLDTCLASLAMQSFPQDGFEVIVVDHKAEPALTLPALRPENTRIIRLSEGEGPGAARRLGAAESRGEIILFMDVDIYAYPDMVFEYARIPKGDPRAVAIGFRDFVDPAIADLETLRVLDPEAVGDYFRAGRLGEGQQWIDTFLEKSDDNREPLADVWVTVVGAGLAVSKSMYDWAGGMRDFPVHGVEDTEFGWRLFNSGAFIVPNRSALGAHLGPRSITVERDRINHQRLGLLANLVPSKRYRPEAPNVAWKVPQTIVQVIVDLHSDEQAVLDTVISAISTNWSDVGVEVWLAEGWGGEEWLKSWIGSDSRVSIEKLRGDAGEPTLPVPLSSRYVARVKAGRRFGRSTLNALRSRAKKSRVGLVAVVSGADDVSVEFFLTSALARAKYSAGRDWREFLRDAYGEHWVSGSDVEVEPLDQGRH